MSGDKRDRAAIPIRVTGPKELGADNIAGALTVSNRLLALGFLFGVVLATVLSLISAWLGSWFTADEAVLVAFASIPTISYPGMASR